MTPEEKASKELFGVRDFHIREPWVLKRTEFVRYNWSTASFAEVVEWYKANPDSPVLQDKETGE